MFSPLLPQSQVFLENTPHDSVPCLDNFGSLGPLRKNRTGSTVELFQLGKHLTVLGGSEEGQKLFPWPWHRYGTVDIQAPVPR